MSDYVHAGRRQKISSEGSAFESQLMFAACYVLFLVRAIATRLLPWHRREMFDRPGIRQSVFAEARSEAGTIVTSSFMGL